MFNYRQNALAWWHYNSDASRKHFVKQTCVKWSELLRLPYFNPIHFTIIDPMHCLFLGISKWIVKQIWINEGILTSNDLRSIQKIINQIQVLANLSQIPGKIDFREWFSNFTVNQWQNFIMIYVTVSLWDHLSIVD